MKRLALEAAKGQSIVGSWGHKFAGPDGRLVGYGMMNAPGLPLTISLVMARDAGVKDPALDKAIELSARLMRFYIGKGAIPYGDHAPWTQTHEDNGKCGVAAVMFNILGEAKGAEFFSRMSTASHGSERDCGHTGNFTNLLWSIPGVAQSGPHATGAWMKEFGAWYYDLARACVAALWRGKPQRIYNVNDNSQLKMGDYFDLAASHGGVLGEAFRKARNVRFCVLSFTSDWLYPTTESRDIVRALNAAGARASFVEIESDKGHDAFLLHEPIMEAALGGFLSSAAKARGLEP